MPSAPAVSDPAPSGAVVQKSVPESAPSFKENVQDVSPQTAADRPDAVTQSTADSATLPPIRVLLFIPAALALAGILAFAVFPSGLLRRIYARRRGSNRDAFAARKEVFPSFNKAVAEPNLPDAQIHTPDELKRNLRQVLQTLEGQLRGHVELKQEALPQRRSSKPALTVG
jgi:hypothetical protein